MYNRSIVIEEKEVCNFLFADQKLRDVPHFTIVSCENLTNIEWDKSLCAHTIHVMNKEDVDVIIINQKSFGNPKMIYVYDDYQDKYKFAAEGITSLHVSKILDVSSHSQQGTEDPTEVRNNSSEVGEPDEE